MATFNVSASADDGRYTQTTFTVVGTTMKMCFGGGQPTFIFIRFNNLNIPSGSTINSAKLTFVSGSNSSGTTVSVNIYLCDEDNAAAPTSIATYDEKPLTSAVSWSNVSSWTLGSSYDTPDLSTILQSVINRAGWALNNSVCFMIQNNGGTSGRDICSYDNTTYTEPILTVTWTEPSGASFTQKVVMF